MVGSQATHRVRCCTIPYRGIPEEINSEGEHSSPLLSEACHVHTAQVGGLLRPLDFGLVSVSADPRNVPCGEAHSRARRTEHHVPSVLYKVL
jgi:hypothetical protein